MSDAVNIRGKLKRDQERIITMRDASSNLRNQGFTLIELLVVMSIISLLVAILLPALSVAREASIRSRCASNQKQTSSVLLLYEQDFKVFPPGDRALTCQIRANAHVMLRDSYGLSVDVVNCPGAATVQSTLNQWSFASGSPIIYYNYFGGDGGGTTANQRKWDGWDGTPSVAWYLANQGLKPALNVGQSFWPSRHMLAADIANMLETTVSGLRPARSNHNTGNDRNNDGRQQNIVFLDGHVEWHVWSDTNSWRFGGDTAERFWWSATWTLPGYQTNWVGP